MAGKAPGVGKITTRSLVQRLVGFILAGFCFMVTVIAADIPSKGLTAVFSCLTIAGIVLFIIGYRNDRLVKKFEVYSRILGADPNKYISMISATLKEPAEVTKRNITKMLELGFFPGMYIEDAKNRLVYQGVNQHAKSVQQRAEEESYIEVKCSGCGAVSKLPAGGTGTCEYCGSPISAPKGNQGSSADFAEITEIINKIKIEL